VAFNIEKGNHFPPYKSFIWTFRYNIIVVSLYYIIFTSFHHPCLSSMSPLTHLQHQLHHSIALPNLTTLSPYCIHKSIIQLMKNLYKSYRKTLKANILFNYFFRFKVSFDPAATQIENSNTKLQSHTKLERILNNTSVVCNL